MKKWMTWFLIIPICAIALHSLYQYILFSPLEASIEPTAVLLFLPVFYLICLCNIGLHLYALISGIRHKKSHSFLTLDSFIQKGTLKWVGLGFGLAYMYDLWLGIQAQDINSIIWSSLAIIVTLFYVSWFNTFKFNLNLQGKTF